MSFVAFISIAKMQSFQKPENALKRANELLSIGQRDAALKILHGAIGHRRFRYVHVVWCLRRHWPCLVLCFSPSIVCLCGAGCALELLSWLPSARCLGGLVWMRCVAGVLG